MAFSLGSIFVELTCNTAKFLSGMDKAGAAAKKTGKDIRTGLGEVGGALANLGDVGARMGSILEGVGNKAASAFDVAANKGRGLGMLVTGTLLGGVTGLAGGMFALAARAANVGSAIFEASEKTGIGAAQMSGLMAITQETKGNFESLTTSLARAGANLAALHEHGQRAAASTGFLARAAKAAGDTGLKPMGDRIQAVLAQIFKWNDEGVRNKALSELLGKAWMQNVSSLKILAEQGYAPAIAEAKKLGLFFDDNAARQAKQFSDSLAILKAEASALGVAIGQKAVPAFSALARALQSIGPDLRSSFWGASAAILALSGDLVGAKKAWGEHEKAVKDADQVQTDWRVHLENLTAGQKAAEDPNKKLTGAVKEHRDALAEIVEREKDELTSLDTVGGKQRQIQSEYQRTVREIDKAVAAGGSYKESLEAQALALDIYKQKLMAIPAILPKDMPGLPGLPAAPPQLNVPSALAAAQLAPSALGGELPSLSKTLAELAKLPGEVDSTRGMLKALRAETELSDASFQRLAAAFPGLTEAEVAATAAGRKMIEQLTKFDQLGTAAEQFTEFRNKLIDEGNDVAGHLIQTLGGAVNQLEDAFAHLAVTGKANFKQIYQGIEESLVKTGLQKGVSTVLGGLRLPGGGGKPDGSSGHPLWVKMAGPPMPGLGVGPDAGAGGAPSLPPGVTGILQSVSKGLGSIGGFLGNIFGGFLAGGGDVTPGKAYVVGEKHPEFFVPKASGAVVPSLSAQTLRPLSYSATYNINTPNPDAFRRTQAQILAEGYRQMARSHARNS